VNDCTGLLSATRCSTLSVLSNVDCATATRILGVMLASVVAVEATMLGSLRKGCFAGRQGTGSQPAGPTSRFHAHLAVLPSTLPS